MFQKFDTKRLTTRGSIQEFEVMGVGPLPESNQIAVDDMVAQDDAVKGRGAIRFQILLGLHKLQQVSSLCRSPSVETAP